LERNYCIHPNLPLSCPLPPSTLCVRCSAFREQCCLLLAYFKLIKWCGGRYGKLLWKPSKGGAAWNFGAVANRASKLPLCLSWWPLEHFSARSCTESVLALQLDFKFEMVDWDIFLLFVSLLLVKFTANGSTTSNVYLLSLRWRSLVLLALLWVFTCLYMISLYVFWIKI